MCYLHVFCLGLALGLALGLQRGCVPEVLVNVSGVRNMWLWLGRASILDASRYRKVQRLCLRLAGREPLAGQTRGCLLLAQCMGCCIG
jgi:hypothetical protein